MNLTTSVIVSVGAFVNWMLNGFKGTFNDQMSRWHEYDSKRDRNYLTGMAVFIVIGIVIIGIAS